ncbi:flagellar export chaperone FliS [Aerosticca soli]|jgi:flagellar protein FliS|uniref:Flagellar secretion chaperone FliS n=1 Tax=Aerosticca soli TaxID=2010829 RepID=A0A2Z6E3N5_9GAMM|nr:flagellar export chaperone FliS [Aerosticca soli]MDI3262747.1 flagellar export chaperone FliS [Fulvimonas sp.]BBD79371.1 flagellar biosynthesis protein FliS [Aerosticca soli]
MTYGFSRASALYQQTRTQGSVEDADPHRLTGMLLDGAIERIAQARGHIRHGDVAGKGTAISKAIAIVGELRGSLNHEVGGELAARLDALYDYITRRLLIGQLNDDDAALAECSALLEPVREGWQGIRDAYLAGRQGSAA